LNPALVLDYSRVKRELVQRATEATEEELEGQPEEVAEPTLITPAMIVVFSGQDS